jgi:N utilization substance protein A
MEKDGTQTHWTSLLVGDLLFGYVKRYDRGTLVVDFGACEGFLARKEQAPGERFDQGERIRVVITAISHAKGENFPDFIVSRTSPELLKRFFETVVPEICDQRVTIKAAVRLPNQMAKIAVASSVEGIDPVSVCKGVKGSRLQAVMRELRGEKIEIVLWSEDPLIFVGNALAPAIIKRITITDNETHQMLATVAEDQFPIALGRKGQNALLAEALTGWTIDISTKD